MSPLGALALFVVVVMTSFVSGVFGMAGGMILIGVLLVWLPLPEAMALHAITQMASNGWRGVLWLRYVNWRAAAAFLSGSVVAFATWSVWRYVPSKGVALILLGLAPFMVRLLPARARPSPQRWIHGMLVGGASMSMMLLAGVSGPLIDTFFLGGGFERRQIVATKAICQLCGHAAKLVYFGGLVDRAGGLDPLWIVLGVVAPIIGTTLARPMLERLTERQYRLWATRIVTTIAIVYLVQGFRRLAFGA